MFDFKRFLTAIIAAVLIFGALPFCASAEEKGDDEPLIVVGTIADPHVDYGIQNKDPYIRPSYITAMNALKEAGIDLLLVGGDMLSDNEDNGGNLRWESEVYARTIEQFRIHSSAASTTGMTLWACGNHDAEVGALKSILSPDDYNSYQGFVDMMLATCGEPVDFFTQAEDTTAGSTVYSDHWLGAHYNIKGFDFIVINPPYGYQTVYTTGVLDWLDETLAKIGEDKTVFITGHYTLSGSRGLVANADTLKGESNSHFAEVMNKYDNAIYLYGHHHGEGESIYISSDTFERVTHYDENGKVVNDRSVNPTSFINAFMGSASYYMYSLNPGWLGAADPQIIQAMTISVYKDRIEFKMINCGKRTGKEEEPAVWTVSREVKFSGELEESEKPILVTEGKNENVLYNSTFSIKSFEMSSDAPTLKMGYHTVASEGFGGYDDLAFTAKRMYFGSKYENYMKKLSSVVNDAVVFEYSVTNRNRKVDIDVPVKVTLPALINEFGEKTATLDLAVYYWNTDGKLYMTDMVVNEDGSYSFVMSNLSALAISERASVKEELSPEKSNGGEKDNTVLIAVCGIILATVIAVACAVIFIKPKKPVADGNDGAKNN